MLSKAFDVEVVKSTSRHNGVFGEPELAMSGAARRDGILVGQKTPKAGNLLVPINLVVDWQQNGVGTYRSGAQIGCDGARKSTTHYLVATHLDDVVIHICQQQAGFFTETFEKHHVVVGDDTAE